MLVASHAGLSACFALAAIVAVLVIDQQHHEATIRYDATRDAGSLAGAVAVGWDRSGALSSVVADQTSVAEGVVVVVFGHPGEEVLLASGPALPPAARDQARLQGSAGRAGAVLTTVGSRPVVVAWAPVEHGGSLLGSVALLEPVAPGLPHPGEVVAVLALATLAVAIAGVVGWLVGRRLAGPIETLAEAAYAGAVGHPPPPVPPRAVREIAVLASTLRSALERSEQATVESVGRTERQRLLVQQVSHNLRTPLSVIGLRVEQLQLLEEEGVDPAERAAILTRLRDQLAVLGHQIDGVIAQSDGRTPDGGEVPAVDLGLVTASRLPGLRALAEHRAQRIASRLGDGVMTRTDPTELAAVVDELVVNAIKFSPERSTVRVSVEADPESGSALLVVSDEGPGIPVAERSEVVKARVRGPDSGMTPGSGLGLYLVSQMLEAWQGSLHLRAAAPGGVPGRVGLEARVVLPLEALGD